MSFPCKEQGGSQGIDVLDVFFFFVRLQIQESGHIVDYQDDLSMSCSQDVRLGRSPGPTNAAKLRIDRIPSDMFLLQLGNVAENMKRLHILC